VSPVLRVCGAALAHTASSRPRSAAKHSLPRENQLTSKSSVDLRIRFRTIVESHEKVLFHS
jgi:hypothetical protein